MNLLKPFVNSSVTQIKNDGIEKMKNKLFVGKNEDEAKLLFTDAINSDFDSKFGKVWDWQHEYENNIRFVLSSFSFN